MLRKFSTFLKDYNFTLIKGGFTFFDNLLVYFFDKKPSRGPLCVGWDVTFRCNAKCSFCSTHELDKALSRSMNTTEAMRVVKQLGEAKVWHLSLTGGEPFVRNDLELLILEAKKYKMIVNVNTNGFLLKKYAKMVIDTGVDSITISVDSDKSEVHDKNRVIPGLTEAISQGIDEVKRLRKGNKPRILVRMVISNKNYQCIDNFIKIYEKKADKIIFQPIHDGIEVPKFLKSATFKETPGLLNLKESDPYMFQAKDRNLFAITFNKFMKKYQWMSTNYNKAFELFLFDKDLMWEKYKCYSGYYYMVINPNGEIFPCQFLFNGGGNLREDTVMDVWCSSQMKKWRKIVKNKKNSCLCWCGMAQVDVTLNHIEHKIFKNPLESIRKTT